MVQSLEFHNYDKRDPDTYPTETGKYLIRYFPMEKTEDHLPTYEILWWKNDFKGFFFDPSCIKENDVEGPRFEFKIFGWAFLPNMQNKNGKYHIKN